MHTTSLYPLTRTADLAALRSLDAHLFSSNEFHTRLKNEQALSGRLWSLMHWMEWFDVMLARRFATSVLLVGAVALLVALIA